MRVYFDTGIFIDYLSTRGSANSLLRSSERRGRSPADIAADAERLFGTVSRDFARRYAADSSGAIHHYQVQIVVELVNISVLDLTSGTVRLQLPQLDLQTRGIRAADALHAASAIAFNADLLVSADDAILSLDGVLMNNQGRKMFCRDTDLALQFL